MGQAKQRQRATAAWLAALSPDDRTIAESALALYRVFPLDGACYRMSFFLKLFLANRHNIDSEVMVGFVNDGTDDLYMSHAWLEHSGRKSDVALARPLQPNLQQPGPLTVLDHTVKAGWQGYSYHFARPPAAVEAMLELAKNEMFQQALEQSDVQHQLILDHSVSANRMRTFLDNAPDGYTYERIADLMS